MRLKYLKQPLIGLFFISIFANANANDLNKALIPAQQLLTEGKFDQAFKLFQLQAKDNALAQMSMGLFYKLAWGKVKQNNQKACQWFYQAASAGIPQAQKEFGDCLNFIEFNVNGIDKYSITETTPDYWYNKAFESGLYDAGCDIGRLYLGTKWHRKNLKKAIEWCLPAAERSAISAQITLGDIYILPTAYQNITSAEYWYQQAIQRNSGEAAFKLANLYYSAAQQNEEDNHLMAKALLEMEKSSSFKYVPSYEKTASLYWQKLQTATQESASEILAKSYLWAKTAYQVNNNEENLAFLTLIKKEMPERWQKELDAQVNVFLN
ncbi:tetratricopeptide repeat protein [Colwelliaceae bacterium 6441]